MPKTKATPSNPSEPSRCTYVTPSGRRCRMAIMPGQSREEKRIPFCAFHARQQKQSLDSEAVAREILGPLGDFRSAFAINRALGKLFTITAENRIPVRNAAVLAYIGQLLLQTLRPLRSEAIETGGQGRMDAILNDAVIRLGDELPKAPFGPDQTPKPSMKALVEECLLILKEAGFNLPPELVRNVKDYDGGDAEEDDEEDDDDDDGISDDGGISDSGGISDGGGINDDGANSENAVASSG
jgi:hypothetical protein